MCTDPGRERDENGKTKVHYTMGDGLEAMRRDGGGGMASGDSSFYHYNHLGTTMALTNAAASVSDTYRHDAWGVRLASTGSTVNPHTYVGRERYFRMPDAGFYHLGFRDYAQRAGRFTTVDPFILTAGHLFVGNGPTALIDPMGLWPSLANCLKELGKLGQEAALLVRRVAEAHRDVLGLRDECGSLDKKHAKSLKDALGKAEKQMARVLKACGDDVDRWRDKVDEKLGETYDRIAKTIGEAEQLLLEFVDAVLSGNCCAAGAAFNKLVLQVAMFMAGAVIIAAWLMPLVPPCPP